MNEFKFTTEQINQILSSLGEIPAKYSLPIIQYIQKLCGNQMNKIDEVSENV